MTTRNDAELLAAFRSSRSEIAFEAIVRRHGPMVLRVCRDIVTDVHAADDAFQATFLVLSRRAGSIRNPSRIGVWLYGVARRVAIRSRLQSRKRASRERLGAEVATMPEPTLVIDDTRNAELRPLLHDEVSRLPSRVREAIILCYFEGATQEQAAQRLRCPLGTLKHRLTRGRELLRERLNRRGVAVTSLFLLMALGEPLPAIPDWLLHATAATAARASVGAPLVAVATDSVARLTLVTLASLRSRALFKLWIVAMFILGAGSLAWTSTIALTHPTLKSQPLVGRPQAIRVGGDVPIVPVAGGCHSN